MKEKNFFFKIQLVILSIILVIASVSLAFVNSHDNFSNVLIVVLVVLSLVITSAACVLAARKSIREYFLSAAKHISSADDSAMNEFPLSMLVVRDGEVVWYNNSFRNHVLKGADVFGCESSFIFDENAKLQLQAKNEARVEYNNQFFNVYSLNCTRDYQGQYIYFFYDDTAFSQLKIEYEDSRPCVLFINIDGLEMLLKNTPESKKNEILGAIERQIEEMDINSKGYLQKITAEKYFMLLDYKGYKEILLKKFEVLSKVRNLDFGERGEATLSIGVGINANNFSECVALADSALEMALGRGGDQAVINNSGEFEFFGGVTESRPANSAVRIRLVANTLKKLILNSENVLVMGHSFSDMDSFGASYGLYCAIKAMGKDVNIVCNYKASLASSLIRYTAKVQPNDEFVLNGDEALHKVKEKTLLIVVDTHRSANVESTALFQKCSDVVVIDHHRRTVGTIENPILFYHDPSSSSTCEMVTELLRYIGVDAWEKSQANALLAGIMLDTKHLVLRTSSRTFAAASHLREKGADPVLVREFFDESMDTYTLKSKIVSSAKVIRNYACAYCEESSSHSRIAAAQAADELLSITGVDVSFVAIVTEKNQVNISARSLGKVNVQTIMEHLGGGGHQTMAAAQVECSSAEEFYSIIADAQTAAQEKQ